MIRTAIVDDEPLARARIAGLLSGRPEFRDVAECENGPDAVDHILGARPDVVFLDVQMPGLDGFGVIERVGIDRMPATVFVTAYDEFALRAFDAQAIDYLLKPFDAARFEQMLEKVKRQLGAADAGGLDARLAALMQAVDARNASTFLERFVIRTGSRITFLDAEEVEWLGAESNYVALHAGGRTHLVRDTLGALEAKLDPGKFVRIHRSTIVRIRAVRSLESVFQGEYVVIMKDGTRLTSSRSYRARLESTLGIA